MRFAVLGSGSKGNATVVQQGGTTVLVDCGFSLRETQRRLARLGLEPGQLDAILVTHEHSDHCSGVGKLSRRFDVPVYMSHGTEASGRCGAVYRLHHFRSEHDFAVGALQVHPVTVPHDAREPCQFAISSGSARVGILTDLGSVTPLVVAHYRGCQALLLECNHDPVMLATGAYPASLKRRISGDRGHLSNAQAAQLLAQLGSHTLRLLVVAHISANNNTRERIVAALDEVRQGTEELVWAEQETGCGWLEVA